MNETQRAFLEQLAVRIPALFDAIARGNVKSEYIIGVRRLGKRQVRLKLVAEVVEPGQQSPLHTHSVLRSVDVADHVDSHSTADSSSHDIPVSRDTNIESRSELDKPGVDVLNKSSSSRHDHRGQAASKRRSPRKR